MSNETKDGGPTPAELDAIEAAARVALQSYNPAAATHARACLTLVAEVRRLRALTTVTDEMVERARTAWRTYASPGPASRARMRAAIEAAFGGAQ